MERAWCNACQADTSHHKVGLTESRGDFVLLVCDKCGRLARRSKRSLLRA